ncbi:MAG: hypothetical protein R3C99_10620 [Pirellulaceae bacterium]|nr:hypothetical protein [Planctomycetales bacterium]MCA9228531.1 hypothetical protein [Planctomycetales bacterium]
MAIEFQCNGCAKRLRVPDESAGKKARCPDCGMIQDVPSGMSEPTSAFSDPKPIGGAPLPSDQSNPFAEPRPASSNPYQTPAYDAPATTHFGMPQAIDFAAMEKVRGPATALIVFAVLGMVMVGVQILLIVVGAANEGDPDVVFELIGGGIGGLISIVADVVIIIGANKMKRLENYGLAMTAAVLSLLCNCGCLSLPFAIWAIVVLSDAQVKAAFRS